MLKKLLIAGCLVWLPIIATIWVIKFIIELLDQLVGILPNAYQPEHLIGMDIPGFGVLIAIIVVLVTGVLVTNFLGDKLMQWWDAALRKIPIIGTIYSTVKQVLHTLVSSDGESFRKVLLIEYPRQGLWSIGFQTAEMEGVIQQASGQKMLSVFIPTTPNPTSGFLVMTPKDQVKELNMSVEDAFKMVVSLGTSKAHEAAHLIKKS